MNSEIQAIQELRRNLWLTTFRDEHNKPGLVQEAIVTANKAVKGFDDFLTAAAKKEDKEEPTPGLFTQEFKFSSFDPNIENTHNKSVAHWVVKNHQENTRAQRLLQTLVENNIPTATGEKWTITRVQNLKTRQIPDMIKRFAVASRY